MKTLQLRFGQTTLMLKPVLVSIFILGSLIGIHAQDYIYLPADGEGATTSGNGTIPSPYYSDINVTRFQCTYNRNELLAGGAPAEGCQINSIGFNIVQVVNAAFYNSGSGLKDYTIKMRNIGIDTVAIGLFFRPISDAHTVKGPFNLNSSVINTTGYTDIIFDTPFFWNGEGNILIDICFGVNEGIASNAANRGVIRMHNFNIFSANPSVRKFNFLSQNMCGVEGPEMQGNALKPVARLNFGPNVPTCNVSVSPAQVTLCPGQSINLNATGATTYQWTNVPILSCIDCPNPVLTPTENTVIQVIGVTGDCSDTATVNVVVNQPQPIPLIQDPPGIDNLCSGPITFSIPDGFTQSQWSNGQNDLNSITISTPGSYSVTANDLQGCPSTSETIVIVPVDVPVVNISPAQDLFLCSGSLMLSASPGFSNYVWSNGQTGQSITVSAPGEYSVSAQNAQGCIGQSSSVTVNPAYDVPVQISASATSICAGGQILISSSQTYNSYLWSNGQNTSTISVNQGGSYSLQVTDYRGCSGTSNTIEVTITEAPTANFTYLQTVGYTVQFTSTSTNAETFFWNFGGGNTSTEPNPSFTYPFDAVYPVTLIVTNSCGSDTITINVIVEKLSSVHDLSDVTGLNVFPNPAQSFVQISGQVIGQKQLVLSIYNNLGQVVYQQAFLGQGEFVLNIDSSIYSKGVYHAILRDNKGQKGLRFIVN